LGPTALDRTSDWTSTRRDGPSVQLLVGARVDCKSTAVSPTARPSNSVERTSRPFDRVSTARLSDLVRPGSSDAVQQTSWRPAVRLTDCRLPICPTESDPPVQRSPADALSVRLAVDRPSVGPSRTLQSNAVQPTPCRSDLQSTARPSDLVRPGPLGGFFQLFGARAD
jgi:hypothetical protein